MKIGIVTVEKSANVGSFLQAYALQKVLEAWGHEVYFVSAGQESIFLKENIAGLYLREGKFEISSQIHQKENLDGFKKNISSLLRIIKKLRPGIKKKIRSFYFWTVTKSGMFKGKNFSESDLLWKRSFSCHFLCGQCRRLRRKGFSSFS